MSTIAINPVPLPLSLGTADHISIHVSFTYGEPETEVIVKYYEGARQILATPLTLNATTQVIDSWNIDVTPIKRWVLSEIGATEVTV
jgi:hypothetical protein